LNIFPQLHRFSKLTCAQEIEAYKKQKNETTTRAHEFPKNINLLMDYPAQMQETRFFIRLLMVRFSYFTASEKDHVNIFKA
jgi:hypothetical protein